MSLDEQMDSHRIMSTPVLSNEYNTDSALVESRSAITPSVRSDSSKSSIVLTGGSTPESPPLDQSPATGPLLPEVQPSQPVHAQKPNNNSPSSSKSSMSQPVSASSPHLASTLHPLEQLGHNVDSRHSNHTTMSGVHLNVTVNGPGSKRSVDPLFKSSY